MRKSLYVAITLMVLGACTSIDKDINNISRVRDNQIHRFYATTEQGASETKVYADENMKVLWNAGDLLTVFNQSTYNSKFQFAGDDGDNAGNFDDVTPSGLHSGNALSNIYAVYPYVTGNKINNAGNTLTLTLPAEQQYKEHSFGIGANTMVAVTDNDFLAFKNLGGYLQLRLYGDDVKVSSITIQGKNGEKIAGKANVAVGLGVTPTVTMDGTATETITLVCDPPVQLGTTAEQYTDFWFVIPPVTFSGGFTITVTDELGGTFEKSTSKSLTISRSTIEWMSALEVVPNYDNVNVVFEDANFKAYCVENFDTNGDEEISVAEALLVTSITVNPEVVASLKGIEYFTNLQSLGCRLKCSSITYSGNELHFYRNGEEIHSLLTSIDLSKNTALTSLNCSFNNLTSLDVSNNTALTSLSCEYNQLTSLDVSNNFALMDLFCWDNQLTSLVLGDNTELKELSCGGNQLTSLDVSHNTALTNLSCSGNQLTSLVLGDNTELKELSCGGNQLTSLDVGHNIALTNLWCANNQLSSLDVSHNTALKELSCDGNQLTTLDVSMNSALTELGCLNNQLTSLDVSHNTALTSLNCSDNQLTSLDVSQNTALIGLECGSNQLTSLDISDCLAIRWLNCCNNDTGMIIYVRGGQVFDSFSHDDSAKIQEKGTPIPSGDISFEDSNFKAYCVQSFDKDGDGEISYAEALHVTSINCQSMSILSLSGIEYFVNLSDLNCSYNKLTSIDVSHNTLLTQLYCHSNQLTSLDVSHNTVLATMWCDNNQLTSLVLGDNTALKELSCDGNQLTILDLSMNSALTELGCYNNQLSSLDVSKNTALTWLHCYNNQLTSLIVGDNNVLTELSCYNNQLTSLDVSHNNALVWLDCAENQLTSLDVSNNTALAGLSCYSNPYLVEIWLKTGQIIQYFTYDTAVATIKRKD